MRVAAINMVVAEDTHKQTLIFASRMFVSSVLKTVYWSNHEVV